MHKAIGGCRYTREENTKNKHVTHMFALRIKWTMFKRGKEKKDLITFLIDLLSIIIRGFLGVHVCTVNERFVCVSSHVRTYIGMHTNWCV